SRSRPPGSSSATGRRCHARRGSACGWRLRRGWPTRDSARGIVRGMSTPLARLKTGYTQGGRDLGMALMARLGALPFTPNQITVAGLALNVVAAALVVGEHFVWATVVFIAGSILDILDGALARTHGKL